MRPSGSLPRILPRASTPMGHQTLRPLPLPQRVQIPRLFCLPERVQTRRPLPLPQRVQFPRSLPLAGGGLGRGLRLNYPTVPTPILTFPLPGGRKQTPRPFLLPERVQTRRPLPLPQRVQIPRPFCLPERVQIPRRPLPLVGGGLGRGLSFRVPTVPTPILTFPLPGGRKQTPRPFLLPERVQIPRSFALPQRVQIPRLFCLPERVQTRRPLPLPQRVQFPRSLPLVGGGLGRGLRFHVPTVPTPILTFPLPVGRNMVIRTSYLISSRLLLAI